MEKEIKKRIEIRVDESEFEIIKQKAESQNKKVATYIKEMAIKGISLTYDYSYLDKYINDVNELQKDIQRFILTTITTGEYFPSELSNIQNAINKIMKNQNKIMKLIRLENKKYFSKTPMGEEEKDYDSKNYIEDR